MFNFNYSQIQYITTKVNVSWMLGHLRRSFTIHCNNNNLCVYGWMKDANVHDFVVFIQSNRCIAITDYYSDKLCWVREWLTKNILCLLSTLLKHIFFLRVRVVHFFPSFVFFWPHPTIVQWMTKREVNRWQEDIRYRMVCAIRLKRHANVHLVYGCKHGCCKT